LEATAACATACILLACVTHMAHTPLPPGLGVDLKETLLSKAVPVMEAT